MKKLLYLVFLLCPLLHGQAVRFDPSNLTQVGQPSPSGMPPLFAIPNASISLCGYPANANPCTNFAPSYTDATATQQCNASQPVTWNGTSTCTSVADGGGSFGFWVAPGNYTYMVTTTSGQTYGPFYFTASPATQGSGGGGSACTGIGSCTITQPLSVASIYDTVYPAICQGTAKPSWCQGSTAGDFILAACNQLPATGGEVNLAGLTGNIPNQVACSSPTKQIIFREDPTSPLVITETDGKITFPLDNNSMFLGPGAGQCRYGLPGPFGGISLDPTARVEAIIGNAHQDGTQENMTVQGVCLWGFTGATASVGLVEVNKIFTNTTVANSRLQVCPTACLAIINAGSITVYGNEYDVTSGAYGVHGIPLLLKTQGAIGCHMGPINVWGPNAEHANGGSGSPEILITGDGAGAIPCSIWIHEYYIERNVDGTPSTVGIQVNDCWGCSIENVQVGGGTGTGQAGDAINISQSAPGRVQSLTVRNITNLFDSYANTLNDTTPYGISQGMPFTFSTQPYITNYVSSPGYQQPPVLPQSTLQSLGTDLMAGAGSFTSGSANFGTGFAAEGCTGLTACTFTRTNSTAPPGATWSQQVQITANTSGGAYNGIIYTPSVSYQGVPTDYKVSVWGKGDGTFTGRMVFLLGDQTVPTSICQSTSSTAFTTSWQLYTFDCTPPASGSSFLNFLALTPAGALGTFWIGQPVVSPVITQTPGGIATWVGPYGLGTATSAQTTTTVNSQSCALGGSCTIPITTTGFTGSKTAGSCVLTISNGLITAVSGC